LRKVSINFVGPGMTVGYPVYNGRGEMLINRGVVLTRRVINRLIRQGVPALYIVDDFFSGIEPKDVLDSRTRVDAVNIVKKVFSKNYTFKLSSEETNVLKSSVDTFMQQLLKNRSIMIDLIDIRCIDDYTFGHCVNVCVLSLVTAIHLGYDLATMTILGMGALMHDIGKILIPKEILNKPGKLSNEEYELIKKHSQLGYDLLCDSKPLIKNLSALIVLQHHERFNGEGYPAGLAREEIHNLSQIVGIADVFDAMTADRVYRPGFHPSQVWEMLAASGDFLFKYELIQAFLANVAPYPSGSVVQLSSDEIGIVVETHKELPLHPRLKVVFDGRGNYLNNNNQIELSERRELSIARVLDPREINELKKKIKNSCN